MVCEPKPAGGDKNATTTTPEAKKHAPFSHLVPIIWLGIPRMWHNKVTWPARSPLSSPVPTGRDA